MPIDSQVEVKQVRLVKGTGAQIAAARQAGEILETDLVAQTDAPDLVVANTAITGATKCKITYDSKGLVTAGADLSSSDITTALGYTPYDSSNPNGYTSNVGTVTSVNNVSPVSGNVTLSIPVVDQSYDGTSTNAQSGVAVKSAIDSAISSVYKPAGSVAFASLPALSSSIEGYVYNITDAFTTTSDFVEGAGKSYPAGTNIVCIDVSGTYKWDVLSGIVDLSGYVPTSRTINSKALTSNITLSASDVGALPDSTVIPTLNSTTNVLPVRNSASSLTDSQFKQTADGRSIGVFGEPDASTSYDKYFSIKGGRLRTYAGGENSYLFQGYTNGGANSAMIAAIMSGNNDSGAYMTFGCCNGTNSWVGSGVKNSFFFASQKNSSGQALKPLKFIVDENCSGTPQIVIATNKKVGIKTENPSYDLDVSGTINASTDIKVNGTSVLTGITSSDVTTALGYTPYDSSNPSGYTSNVGTVTSVNNVSPVNGNVTLSIPSEVTETTVSNWGFTKNAGTVTSVNNVSPVNGNVTLSIPNIDNLANKDLSNLSTTGNSKFQEPLVSGTNIKTINNTSILGSGNISVESLPSQSGQSGKYLTTNGTTASWGVPKTFNLLDWKWSDHELSDQSWLNADTFSWQNGTTYSDVYSHLVDDYNGGTSQTDTVGSYTISYKLATDGHKITTDESTVANIYNETGVAWYYVLDTTNQRFKLPRENPAREELIQVVRAKGNGKTIGLTNGTSNAGMSSITTSSIGCIPQTTSYDTSVDATQPATGNYVVGKIGITTNPDASGIIADMTDSTSVYKGKQYLYFYVGQYSQTATEQTAGLNSELFNGKLDLDLGNITTTAKDTLVGWGIPDYSSGISISSGYVAVSNGMVCVNRGAGSQQVTLYVDNVAVDSSLSSATNNSMSLTAFVRKGSTITWTAGNPQGTPTFFPLIGG